MAKRGDPKVLRHVVVFLRFKADLTQEEFGKAAGVHQGLLSRYERGQQAPSEKTLRRMATAADMPWPLVVQMQSFFAVVLAAAGRRTSVQPVAEPLDAAALEPVLLAVAPYLAADAAAEPNPQTPEEARREAEQVWAALERFPQRERRRLLELAPRASQSGALAVRVCDASERAAADTPGEALELADLALWIAQRAAGSSPGRLEGYCWAHMGNARRVANDHTGADVAFRQAWDLWRRGADADPELLTEWRLLDLEASLRRDQRRFPESLDLLDRALAASGGDQAAAGRILLKKEFTLEQMGDIEGALAALAGAAPLVEASGDPHLLFTLRFNTADDLRHLEHYEEAAARLPGVRELAEQQGNDLDLLRLAWLEARVAAGLGRKEEAMAGLEQVQRAFTERTLAYDAALAGLDLAALWLEAGRTAEVRELAVAMAWIFKAKGIAREALASLKLFCEAAQWEKATAALARRTLVEVEKAMRVAPAKG